MEIAITVTPAAETEWEQQPWTPNPSLAELSKIPQQEW